MSRPTLKVRLSDTGSAWETMQIVSAWRKARLAARYVASAIRLYASLANGRTEVLIEMFPWLGLVGKSVPVAASTERREVATTTATVILDEPSAEDAANDFLSSLGL